MTVCSRSIYRNWSSTRTSRWLECVVLDDVNFYLRREHNNVGLQPTVNAPTFRAGAPKNKQKIRWHNTLSCIVAPYTRFGQRRTRAMISPPYALKRHTYFAPFLCRTSCSPSDQAAKKAARSKDPALVYKYKEETRRVDTLRYLLVKHAAKVGSAHDS